MKKLIFCSTMVMLVLMLSASVWGASKNENFSVTLGPNNSVIEGGGSGWGNGEWIYYGETDWWNQWFYDDPPDPTRYKVIDYNIILVPGGGPGSFVDVAINWSNLQYLATGPDGQPPMPNQEEFIDRGVLFSGELDVDLPLIGRYIIPDYNPEWVSIDIRYYNQDQVNGPALSVYSNYFVHECVPEPATLVLLATGVLGLAVFAWRRRR
jgi:hypothetical protein